jgi:hypothetical protein
MLTFLIVILGLYLFSRIASRWILPWLLHRYITRMQERINPQGTKKSERRRETEIHIPRKQKVKSNRDYSNAEYIDFEEIDDDN